MPLIPNDDGTYRLRIDTAPKMVPFLEPARYKASRGGRGSMKSYDRADAMIEMAICNPGFRGMGVREVQKSLKRSSKQLIEDRIKYHGVSSLFEITREEIRGPGDGFIGFTGMKDHTAESAKSMEGIDVFWIEEAQSLSKHSLNILLPTARDGVTLGENCEIWATWNTRFPDDPIDEMFFGGEPPPDSIIVESTYLDNPWFPESLRKEMEWMKRRDPDAYAHIWLGGYQKNNEARVFKNWRVEDFEPPLGETFYYGADWGFSVDPTVLVRSYLDADCRTLYVCDEAWEVGCETDMVPFLFGGTNDEELDSLCAPAREALRSRGIEYEGVPGARRWPIVADSARPETISYMRRHGFSAIVGAKKGPGSVEDGVEFLKSVDIVVAPHCVHVIDELSRYSYKVDKRTERVLPILEDKKNHVIDALRYSLEGVSAHVRGATESQDSRVSRSYDGSTTVERRTEDREESAAELVSASGFYADDVAAFDGGLT